LNSLILKLGRPTARRVYASSIANSRLALSADTKQTRTFAKTNEAGEPIHQLIVGILPNNWIKSREIGK